MAPIQGSLPVASLLMVDDPRLIKLREDLEGLAETGEPTILLTELIRLLEPHQRWTFEEQVDLHQWVQPLNLIDRTLRWTLDSYPRLLLVPRVERKSTDQPKFSTETIVADSVDEVRSTPVYIPSSITILLRFSSGLLRNSAGGKYLYSSIPELIDLLGAGDDSLASAALETLYALSLPPALHKQQSPEIHSQHGPSGPTGLSQAPSTYLARITSMARGWGTRAYGLGLYQAVTVDDSVSGQGKLPATPGEVHFVCHKDSDGGASIRVDINRGEILAASSDAETSQLIDRDGFDTFEPQGLDQTSKKRRRVAARIDTKSSAELFFLALHRCGGRDQIPVDQQFSLLSDIRLARSYHSQSARQVGVEDRLRAIITMLYGHPSQEVLAGYFQAQPEISTELIDLLRPTISASNVSATRKRLKSISQDNIDTLVDWHGLIPFGARMLALEALTALLSRRDGATGSLPGSVRSSSVLADLGVGKGQYLGFLPTLIRSSLSPLGSASTFKTDPGVDVVEVEPPIGDAFDFGLAFVEASMAPQLPRIDQIEYAFEFMDNVLTLTSSVISSPTGTSSLTDCGLVPALLSIVYLDPDKVISILLGTARAETGQIQRVKALLRFITAQSVQILEGAIVTHTHALTAFHDLHGVEAFIDCLAREIQSIQERRHQSDRMSDSGSEMEEDQMTSSQRVLLFSIVTGLTVVFHQETGSSDNVSAGGAQLRKEPLTRVIIEVLDHVVQYGGHVAALIATLLSDVMNNDPHVVHHVHEAGIAASFLRMVCGKSDDSTNGIWPCEPFIPPVPELIMAVPNVIAAIALTEDGAKAVLEANPFPALLCIFYHPRYAMPVSRCLLNEMAAIIGTGLDEIMRHVDRLKPIILQAVTSSLVNVVKIAEILREKERQQDLSTRNIELETERSCLIQYVLSFGQLLDQLLHNEEDCNPFVETGGLDVLLKLFGATLPQGRELLAHLSGMSTPSVGTLHHSTIEERLSLAFKGIVLRYDPTESIRKTVTFVRQQLDEVEKAHQEIFDGEAWFGLQSIPNRELFLCSDCDGSSSNLRSIAEYLRAVISLQWSTSLLGVALRSASQKSNESSSRWNGDEEKWKSEICGEGFRDLVNRLAEFYGDCLLEVSRYRGDPGFEALELGLQSKDPTSLTYRLRIVCPEGAVIRDGTEIDSCENVGSMEMGEVVESCDRCINSSGILRFRTSRGWVSEMTRGHGREPIAEVIDVTKVEITEGSNSSPSSRSIGESRIEANIPPLRYVVVNVFARGQCCYSELLGSLSRLVFYGVRSVPLRSFEHGTAGWYVATLLKTVASCFGSAFGKKSVVDFVRNMGKDSFASSSGGGAYATLYLAAVSVLLQHCVFEDKRERRLINLPLLLAILCGHGNILKVNVDEDSSNLAIFDVFSFILKEGLVELSFRHPVTRLSDFENKKPFQRVPRSVAGTFPTILSFLRRLLSNSFSSSPTTSVMSRMKLEDASTLLGFAKLTTDEQKLISMEGYFYPEGLIKKIHVKVSVILREIWSDNRLYHLPPFLLNPLTSMVFDTMACLEDGVKGKKQVQESDEGAVSERVLLSDLLRRRRSGTDSQTSFEPSEEAVAQLMEMGFDREQALDALESTQSNRVETAMDYALSHPRPSPATIARRRLQREERARRREARVVAAPEVTNEIAEGANTSLSTPEVDAAEVAKTEPFVDSLASEISAELSRWVNEGPDDVCKLLNDFPSTIDVSGDGDHSIIDLLDGEREATTTILTSFMIEMCRRVPEKTPDFVVSLLRNIKRKLTRDESSAEYSFQSEAESSVTALLHAAAVLTRALPQTRLLILKENLCGPLVTIVSSTARKVSSASTRGPRWLTPAVLLIDIMTQPLAAFASKDLDGESGGNEEIDEVREEHKMHARELATLALDLFSLISPMAAEGSVVAEDAKGENSENSMDIEKGSKTVSDPTESNPFAGLPPYVSMLPPSLLKASYEFCRLMLCRQDAESSWATKMSPGVTHAVLLLLLRLLKDGAIASLALQDGIPEAILHLSKDSSFNGHAGLVTLVLRRIIEDSNTLQSEIEAELRSIATKLFAKKRQTGETKLEVQMDTFLQSAAPLLCRDPSIFLKAFASTCDIKSDPKDPSKVCVSLLSQEERLVRGKVLSQCLATSLSNGNAGVKDERRRKDDCHRRSSSGGKVKSKLPKNPKRLSSAKKSKKDRLHSSSIASDAPAVHIVHLLMTSIMDIQNDDLEGGFFLCQEELLDALADLILVVPGCTSAIHNFKFHRLNEKAKRKIAHVLPQHALFGCATPSKTFTNFLLHSILPQNRWRIRNDFTIWERRKESSGNASGELLERKRKAASVIKRCQAAARVLVALVSRPGEGRKRILSELVFALSGGLLNNGVFLPGTNSKVAPLPSPSCESDLHALDSWGELCYGLLSPRGNGKVLEGLSLINIEIVRLMAEHGMVHAILYAVKRAELLFPSSSSTLSNLLLPFEVLTRANVQDALKHMQEKGEHSVDETGHAYEEYAPANLVHDEQPVPTFPGSRHESDGEHYESLAEAEESAMDEEENHDEMEVDDDGDNEDSGDDESSSQEDTDVESSDDVDDSGIDEGMEDSEVGSSDDDTSDDMEEGPWEWEGGYDHNLHPEEEADAIIEENAEDEATDPAENGGTDETWTRIESTGFGGVAILHARRPQLLHRGERGSDGRDFVDAAEAMIGTLLRDGEVSGDAVAELEGALGIRIRGPLGHFSRSANDPFSPRAVPTRNDSMPRSEEIVGSIPIVNQRNQPDISFSSFGRSGHWGDTSTLEFVFGGPSISAVSRNYDLISPARDDEDPSVLRVLAQSDLPLFPGGPASAANLRTQRSTHPLLCGVDLPPSNALVSDLVSHESRARRRTSSGPRRPGTWTDSTITAADSYALTASSNSLIRSNRTSSGAPTTTGSNRDIVGPVGWTDDGLPVDGATEELSVAVGRALGNIARTGVMAGNSGSMQESRLHHQNDAEAESDRDAQVQTEQQNGSELQQPRSQDSNENNQNANEQDQELESFRSEGDLVATSLATDLRLSPRSETSMNSAENIGHGRGNFENQSEAVLLGNNPESADDDESDTEHVSNLLDDGNQDCLHGHEGFDLLSHEPVGNDDDHVETGESQDQYQQGDNALVCPPNFDPDVFNSLPRDMQQDCVDQYNAAQAIAAELDGSNLDPEVLAALPEDMRREVIEQDRRERRLREQEQAPADPAHAEEMDNASFLASLAPDLREEILLTADEVFLSSLPASIQAEAELLRERARISIQHRRTPEESSARNASESNQDGNRVVANSSHTVDTTSQANGRRKARSGKMRVEKDREYLVQPLENLPELIGKVDVQAFIRIMYLVCSVRPARLFHRTIQNLCGKASLRIVFSTVFVRLLGDDASGALAATECLEEDYISNESWRRSMDEIFKRTCDEFPPVSLLGVAPDFPGSEGHGYSLSASFLRRKQGFGATMSLAASLPKLEASGGDEYKLPPVVSERIIETMTFLCKNSPRFCVHVLTVPILEGASQGCEDNRQETTTFDVLLDLLDKPLFHKSSYNLDQLLNLLEAAVSPLSHVSKFTNDVMEVSKQEEDAARSSGKEWIDSPRISVAPSRLQHLCSILRMESCRDAAFAKVNTIIRRICRVETNRGYILSELASVAHAMGSDAVRDLRALKIRMEDAVERQKLFGGSTGEGPTKRTTEKGDARGSLSSTVTLSTSTSELKLLRVLKTLHALCNDSQEESSRRLEGNIFVTEELVHLLRQMHFEVLWDELSACLKLVQVLEGVSQEDQDDRGVEDMETEGEDEINAELGTTNKKLRNSAAGLLTRFLPSIETFFLANASATRPKSELVDISFSSEKPSDMLSENVVGGNRLMDFITTNKVLLNALVRSNAGLLEKGFRALVQIPRCRGILDFDVKRQWFKTQVRRLRQQASRRHGTLRLVIRRKHVFEDAYNYLRLRNAEEMRGRLHVTFRDEEGVDAGGLSREFFAILAKEIFNPNYALFTSTEDGCTFQPNPHSSINPDHLSFFRFVGRIVGKAVMDGYLLDAHFTRSLYKHMLGLEPTHHDMEGIDPDYYRNLKTILDYNLADIGLDLTFSIEEHSFGRKQIVDLIPNGRNIPVTEESKEEYVRLICQNRMTTAIKSQTKAYLDGFYEMVSPELISIFTPRELELLISGLPDIDVHDLKKNTEYVGWKATDKEIQWFWNIMFSLSRSEKAAFLQFVTGSSKVPLAGFSELQGMRGVQKFSIHKKGGFDGSLVSAHTCFNSLDLPCYKSEDEMREKLLFAITEGGGAFLFA